MPTPPTIKIQGPLSITAGFQDPCSWPVKIQPPVRVTTTPTALAIAPAIEAADIASTLVAEFRRHLKTCSKLPASLASNDDVKVKLRVLMTPDGRLAGEPILIEASASMKGPLLMQGAIRALSACQPYAMLPVDRYGEWKVLDLSFTPRDFSAS